MKPKRDLVIGLMTFFILWSVIGFADDVYKTSTEDSVHAVCGDFSFYYKDSKKVFTRHYMSIKNNTPLDQQVVLTYTGCFDTGKCEQKSYTVNLAGWQFYVSQYEDYYHDVNINRKGRYHFTSITDVNGYKNMHAQKTCNIDIRGD